MATSIYILPDTASDTESNASTVQAQPHRAIQCRRSETSSSTSSTTIPTTLPPGLYTLPIHGSCPRCHHYHKSAAINVRFSSDPSRISHVHCERCKAKWFALGLNNSTRISLLSTQTTEPDITEQSFRYTLMDMIRSTTSVASAALASVPENPPLAPTRPQSVHPGAGHAQEPGQNSFHKAGSNSPARAHDGTTEPSHSEGNDRQSHINRHPESAMPLFDKLRSRIKKRLQSMRVTGFRKFLLSDGRTYSTEKSLGKLPVVEVPPDDEPSSEARSKLKRAAIAPLMAGSTAPEASGAASKPVIGSIALDKERVQKMSKERQVKWFRERLTEFRAQQTIDRQYERKGTSMFRTGDIESRLSPPPPSSRSSVEPPIRRCRSEDLLLIGSHLPVLQSTDFYASQSISVSSTARFSQTGTAVNSDSLTATSGAQVPDGRAHAHDHVSTHLQSSSSSMHLNGLNDASRQNRASSRLSMASVPSLSLTGDTSYSLSSP